MRDIKDSTTTTLTTRVAEQLSSLRGLQSRLVEIRDYLLGVSRGELPINHPTVYFLQDALNLLPDLDDPDLTKAFTTNTNDQLLVVYLSSLVRAVIALERLVENKATNGLAELEEGQGGKVKPKSIKNKEGKEKKESEKDGKESTEKSEGKGKEK